MVPERHRGKSLAGLVLHRLTAETRAGHSQPLGALPGPSIRAFAIQEGPSPSSIMANVVDTKLYDILGVSPTTSANELKTVT
ncbi:hypothetical protein AAFF_G00251860 [Aldrovandia affinis]|uniref:Uncharacterized protein n=1 Tax=Aldrovandia affinis TaxID=143900 RepID=A0AAD7WT74_9TELE|nr:hypothetical protein AAFF_G00251860 [Aldrovandia affinis]